MKQLVNAIRLHGGQAVDRALMRVGEVTSYDPATYAVKVLLHPEGTETGWMPVLSAWVGNGWGLFAPPSPGDFVDVGFLEGDATQMVARLRFFNDVDRPLSVPSGEFWLVHQSGAFIKLPNDGTVSLKDQAGSTLVMNGDGTGTMTFSAGLTVNANVQVNGNLVASGDISDQNGAKSTLQHVRDVFNPHTHHNVQPGAGNSGSPNTSL